MRRFLLSLDLISLNPLYTENSSMPPSGASLNYDSNLGKCLIFTDCEVLKDRLNNLQIWYIHCITIFQPDRCYLKKFSFLSPSPHSKKIWKHCSFLYSYLKPTHFFILTSSMKLFPVFSCALISSLLYFPEQLQSIQKFPSWPVIIFGLLYMAVWHNS